MIGLLVINNKIMDRCRCEDYARAVEKIKFYTVGTLRPDILENFDPSGYVVRWNRQTPSYSDFKFSKPDARPVPSGRDPLSHDDRRIEHMWCPYMTPVKK